MLFRSHLFRLMDEDKYLAAGDQKNVFELAGVKSASFICYDIRFPEWLRTVAKKKLSVIYVVAQWPQTRIEQWKSLLVARAIENQAYVVAVNRVGDNPDNKFNGHSLIINPLGEVLSDSGDQETLTVYLFTTFISSSISLTSGKYGITTVFLSKLIFAVANKSFS